jgi:hypothetical protein
MGALLGRLRVLVTVLVVAGLLAGSAACRAERRHSGVVSGNGMVGLPAEEVLAKATDAARRSTSVRIKGQVVQRGKTAGLDLRLKGAEGGVGTVTFESREFHLVRVGRDLYVTGGPGAFAALGRAGRLVEGKPVRVSASDPRFTEVVGFTDLHRIFALLLKPAPGLSKGEQMDVNGRHALALRNAAGRGGTLWVATSGTPYPLRLDAPPSAGVGVSGVLDFLEYGAPVALTPPAGAVDLG